jgi:hypothetical protein
LYSSFSQSCKLLTLLLNHVTANIELGLDELIKLN